MGLRPGPTDERIDSQMFFLKSSDDSYESSEGGEGDRNIDYAVRMRNNIEKYYSKQFNNNQYEDHSPLQVPTTPVSCP